MLSRFSSSDSLLTLWTVAHQAPLSMGFSRQEYWSGIPCPPPGDLPNPGIKPRSLTPPASADSSLPLAPLSWLVHNKNVFLTVLQAGRVPVWSGSSKDSLLGYRLLTSPKRKLCWPSFRGAQILNRISHHHHNRNLKED